jgi:hypothetical protein
LPDGKYRFEISAKGIDDEDVKVSTYIEGRITGLTFEDSLPLLHIGSIKVPIGDVYEILEEKVVEEAAAEEEEEATPETPPQSTSDPDSSPQ